MNIVLIRHAHAEGGRPDSERALSKEGIQNFKKSFDMAQSFLPPAEKIIDSQYKRSVQTADIVAQYFSAAERVSQPEFQPEFDPEDGVEVLSIEVKDNIYVVGHNPNITALAGLLLNSTKPTPLVFKKGAVLWLEGGFIGEHPHFQIRSFTTSKQLRNLDKNS